MGNCFLDEPEDHHFNVPDMLPGALYNADFQCKHTLTADSRECDIGSVRKLFLIYLTQRFFEPTQWISGLWIVRLKFLANTIMILDFHLKDTYLDLYFYTKTRKFGHRDTLFCKECCNYNFNLHLKPWRLRDRSGINLGNSESIGRKKVAVLALDCRAPFCH